MTDKELRRMSRNELLEMLIAQVEENEKQRQELEEARAALQDRQIAIEKVGSIAEASLQLSGIFEAAQIAADQYLENIRQMNSQQDTILKKIQQDAREQADAIIAEAESYSFRTHKEADAYQKDAHEKADEYWQQISDKVNDLLHEHQILKDLIQQGRNIVHE